MVWQEGASNALMVASLGLGGNIFKTERFIAPLKLLSKANVSLQLIGAPPPGGK